MYVVLVYEANSLIVLIFLKHLRNSKHKIVLWLVAVKTKSICLKKNLEFSACTENRKILPKLCIYGYAYDYRKNTILIACLKLLVLSSKKLNNKLPSLKNLSYHYDRQGNE